MINIGDKMNTKIYTNQPTYIAGMTLKDFMQEESNNMAFHVCQSEDAVLKNRETLANTLSVELNDFVCANQTHSANFYEVSRSEIGRGAVNQATEIKNTDALYTYEPNIMLCTLTADCVPVLFYHEKTGVIGAIHSGWQGTVKEITRKLFTYLIEVEKNEPTDFNVYIGMALSQEKFEVDDDVYEQFQQLQYADEFMYKNAKTNKFHIDNQLTVKQQCILTGIPESNIVIDRTCTFQDKRGFSYREDKQTGRHLSFIMRKKG